MYKHNISKLLSFIVRYTPVKKRFLISKDSRIPISFTFKNTLKNISNGVRTGAEIGETIGQIVSVIGSGMGKVVGGIIGGIGSFFKGLIE